MKVVIWKKDRINYVVNGICRYYKITPEQLFKKYKNPIKTRRKRIALMLLKDVADISIPEIAEAMSVTPQPLYYQYKAVVEDISPTTYGNKELKREYLEILDYLKL